MKLPSLLAFATAASTSHPQHQHYRLFVFGLGYTAQRLVHDLLLHPKSTLDTNHWCEWEVVGGTCSSLTKAKQVKDQWGVPVWPFDSQVGSMTDAKALEALRSATHVLSSIPPLQLLENDVIDPVLKWHAADLLLSNQSSSSAAPKRWIGYLSSTSVYGDQEGGWVTEETPPNPISSKGKARLAAEQAWCHHTQSSLATSASSSAGGQQQQRQQKLRIFRLAGIYGPGRSALDTLRRYDGDLEVYQCSARTVLDDEHVISRIHVEDLVQAVRRCMEVDLLLQQQDDDEEEEEEEKGLEPPASVIYNLADDQPASRLETFTYASHLLLSTSTSSSSSLTSEARILVGDKGGVDGDQGTGGGGEGSPSSSRRRKAPESKRVSNEKAKARGLCVGRYDGEDEQSITLKYKTYREGLKSIWEQMMQERRSDEGLKEQ